MKKILILIGFMGLIGCSGGSSTKSRTKKPQIFKNSIVKALKQLKETVDKEANGRFRFLQRELLNEDFSSGVLQTKLTYIPDLMLYLQFSGDNYRLNTLFSKREGSKELTIAESEELYNSIMEFELNVAHQIKVIEEILSDYSSCDKLKHGEIGQLKEEVERQIKEIDDKRFPFTSSDGVEHSLTLKQELIRLIQLEPRVGTAATSSKFDKRKVLFHSYVNNELKRNYLKLLNIRPKTKVKWNGLVAKVAASNEVSKYDGHVDTLLHPDNVQCNLSPVRRFPTRYYVETKYKSFHMGSDISPSSGTIPLVSGTYSLDTYQPDQYKLYSDTTRKVTKSLTVNNNEITINGLASGQGKIESVGLWLTFTSSKPTTFTAKFYSNANWKSDEVFSQGYSAGKHIVYISRPIYTNGDRLKFSVNTDDIVFDSVLIKMKYSGHKSHRWSQFNAVDWLTNGFSRPCESGHLVFQGAITYEIMEALSGESAMAKSDGSIYVLSEELGINRIKKSWKDTTTIDFDSKEKGVVTPEACIESLKKLKEYRNILGE